MEEATKADTIPAEIEAILKEHPEVSYEPNSEPTSFVFELGDDVVLLSGEKGYIIGRAEFAEGIDSYLVRYKAADGRLVEGWWNEPAIFGGAKGEETVPDAT